MGVLSLAKEDACSFPLSDRSRLAQINPKGAHTGRRLATLAEKPGFRALFLAVLGFCVHLPALQGQFLWDDVYLARDNPFIKSPLLALEAFRHQLFLGSAAPHYRPVQNLSYILDYYLWNTEAAGFHLTNILLHLASGLLLYRLLLLLLRPGRGIWPARMPFLSPELAAFIVAAIWIVHPVHSAAVDYISGRADSLAFMFAAGGWLLFLQGSENKGWCLRFTLYFLASLCGLLALCSREIACVWLALFLIHTLVFANEITQSRKIAAALCSVIILGAYAGLRQLPGAVDGNATSAEWPAVVRVTLMLRALGDYARLLFWPSNLHMERTVFIPSAFCNRAGWRNAAPMDYLSVLGLLAVAATIFSCVRRSAGQRLRIFGVIWFFAAYLPISNIVQLNATVAEHWLYLPSVGALVFLVGCFIDLPPRAFQLAGPLVALAVTVLAIRSTIRSSDWRDDQTLFSRTVAAGGYSARVMVNLAQCYADRAQYPKAEEIYRRIVQLNPHYTVAWNNLGCVLSHEGKITEAEAIFSRSSQEALAFSRGAPHNWLSAWNYAHLRHAAHDDASAIASLERARVDYPETWEVISSESELLRDTKGSSAALILVRDFAERNWWHYGARLAEGRLFAEANDVVHAEASLRAAATLDVHGVEGLNLLSRIYLGQNQLELARETQRRAVARQPDKPTEYAMLAIVLEKMGRTREANAALEKIARLRSMAVAQPAPLAAVAN
jgi:protein O-mannosyl-transferase